jgi:hypothetical protein
LYGSTPLEDIIDYNQLARSLTEWSSTNDNNTINQSSIAEGIGGITYGVGGGLNVATSLARVYVGQVHVRKTMIQGLDLSATLDIASTGLAGFANGAGAVPNQFGGTTLASHPLVVGTNSIRRYQVQLALGLFNQDKLIPVKFMASQLAIEITLAQESDCMFYQSAMTTAVNPPTYVVGNINLIPEILEFDDMYNANFIEGLENGGIPIKFSTWNNYKIGTGGGSTCNLQIQERSRSVKAIFALLKRDPPLLQQIHMLHFLLLLPPDQEQLLLRPCWISNLELEADTTPLNLFNVQLLLFQDHLLYLTMEEQRRGLNYKRL